MLSVFLNDVRKIPEDDSGERSEDVCLLLDVLVYLVRHSEHYNVSYIAQTSLKFDIS